MVTRIFIKEAISFNMSHILICYLCLDEYDIITTLISEQMYSLLEIIRRIDSYKTTNHIPGHQCNSAIPYHNFELFLFDEYIFGALLKNITLTTMTS